MPQTSSENIISLILSLKRKLRQEFHCAGGLLSDLTMAQMETLVYIAEQEPVLMKNLAEYLSITPPSATALANHLMRLGFIKREPDKKDKRAAWLTLNQKGFNTFKQAMEYRKKTLTKFLKRLDNHEQRQLAYLINKLIV